MKPRLHHVAELAGVSQATVSRVLNDRAGVADQTRRAVLRALGELGYEPKGIAGTRRRGLVGLVVPELHNPVFPRFAQEIESRLSQEGLTTALCTATPGLGEQPHLDVLLEHGATGVVVISGRHADLTEDHRNYLDLRARGSTVVLINGRAPGLDLPALTVDHAAAARTAVAHLATLGHRRIALVVGPNRRVPTRELVEGYLEEHEHRDLEHDPTLVVETTYDVDGGRAAGQRLLGHRPTAVVCASDLLALGVIRTLRARGLRVPEEVSVIGFDDAGPSAYLDPPLTSLRQPFEAIAAGVVRLLVEHAAHAGPPADEPVPDELRFQADLVVRASTAPVAGAGPPDPGRIPTREGPAPA